MSKRMQFILSVLRQRRVKTGAMILALVFALGFGVYTFRDVFLSGGEGGEDSSRVGEIIRAITPNPEVKYRHPLTGQPLEEKPQTIPQVISVMIDHGADAWPQSGVDQAFLVIEAPVEANIPRLQAFFYEGQDIEKIGPVRSARPYFIDWNSEFDGLYTHVGGSPEALQIISTNGTLDLNEFWNGASFWRSRDRYAPHNTYTSSTLLGEALERLRERDRVKDPLYGSWSFKEPEPSEEEGVDLSISFRVPTYVTGWQYDVATNRYQRYQAGRVYTMQDGSEVFADNVLVVVTDVQVIDSVGRKRLKTIGEGEAIIFQDGKKIEGIWKNPSASERMVFETIDGEEVRMNPGATWIEVVADRDWMETLE